MARYRGDVEQARKDLRAMGSSQQEARRRAPQLAEMRLSQQDGTTMPYSWLGGKALDKPRDDRR
jgi:hypothetical protein